MSNIQTQGYDLGDQGMSRQHSPRQSDSDHVPMAKQSQDTAQEAIDAPTSILEFGANLEDIRREFNDKLDRLANEVLKGKSNYPTLPSIIEDLSLHPRSFGVVAIPASNLPHSLLPGVYHQSTKPPYCPATDQSSSVSRRDHWRRSIGISTFTAITDQSLPYQLKSRRASVK
ncbi:hypothetical protein SISNIDRAFT_489504 [Sistotremastrum niveocremeum HHB9708]|uniref:Uncharacterized protein n=1 Tax=Sistotremastrum niveocremeum HHB9708 TaxID=1314777 RepID=A0A164PV18_9AGAM|nr:hypothetical protein SISNIDRAFT_489504 [Sistotremastrum niveocremeum HHB9708]